MAELQIPPSINDARAQAHLALAARLGAIDLTPLLVYRLESVPANALPFLAWQFDVQSPLWALIAPGGASDQRALIESAAALHRVRGTPYAIKTALASLGWANATIQEGQASWGGSSYPADEGWAVCRLIIPIPALDLFGALPWSATTAYQPGAIVTYLGNYFYATGTPVEGTPPQFTSIDEVTDIDSISDWDDLTTAGWLLFAQPWLPIDGTRAALINQAFEFFKPARAWLDSAWFVVPPETDSIPVPIDRLALGGIAAYTSDTALPPAEAQLTISVSLAAISDTYPPIAPLYRGHYKHHGVTHGAGEPRIADSTLIINGVIDGESQ